MKEIAERLKENRQIQLAKEILESKGYSVCNEKSLNESASFYTVSGMIEDRMLDRDTIEQLEAVCKVLGAPTNRVYIVDEEDPRWIDAPEYNSEKSIKIPGYSMNASIGTVEGGAKAIYSSDYGYQSLYWIKEGLSESHRVDEAKKREAIDSLLSELRSRLSKVEGYSHHKLKIAPNYSEGYIEIFFKGTNDSFVVYPEKNHISNENSSKVVKVVDLDGAYIEGTKVYDSEGNELGEALIRMKAIHNKSDYSPSLEKASYKFNSKISSMRNLEKYIAREAIDNMK